MNGTTKRSRRRERAFREQRGLCHWCRQPMHLQPQSPNDPLAATLEHVDDRWSPFRGLGAKKNVAAHKQCNNERSAQNERVALTKEKRP